jgi:hypothetical protein
MAIYPEIRMCKKKYIPMGISWQSVANKGRHIRINFNPDRTFYFHIVR